MTRTILIVLLFLMSLSCGNDLVKKPSDLISETKMVDIIVDFALLNSGAGIDKNILADAGITPENHVYKKYGIDSLQFAASNNYYAHNIDAYRDIYSRVKSKLNNKKEEYKKLSEQEKNEKKKNDSIRRVEKRRNKPSLIKGDSSTKLKQVQKPKSLAKIVDSLQK